MVMRSMLLARKPGAQPQTGLRRALNENYNQNNENAKYMR